MNDANATHVTFTIDIAHEIGSLASALVEITKDRPDVMYRVMELEGSAYQWPTVRFEGPTTQMVRLALDYMADDIDGALALIWPEG